MRRCRLYSENWVPAREVFIPGGPTLPGVILWDGKVYIRPAGEMTQAEKTAGSYFYSETSLCVAIEKKESNG